MAETKIEKLFKSRLGAADEYLTTKRGHWDDYENMFFNKLDNNISENTKSQVFDPKLSTLAIERSNRVMSTLPMGKVRGISKNDNGRARLANLMLSKYIIPNANSQFDLLTKLRMVDLYSNIYGNFFSLVDWNIDKTNGYIGPDLWLLNIRDVFPQVGAVSVQDSDFIIVRTWQPESWFKSRAKDGSYKNMAKVLRSIKDKTGDKPSRDENSQTQREQEQYPDAVSAKKSGFFEVYSMYERDRWVEFAGGDRIEIRNTENPHKNGELPVECKYSMPLMSDFMGMGDFERGESMQKTINSLWNLYLDAVKISIFPPVLLNKDNIASTSSIKWSPAAKWLIRNNVNNSAQVMNLTPQGINTFNNTYQVVTAALLNQFGTTSTETTSSTDPGFGKTPQALKMQAARESSRDNSDRFYMEQYLKRVMKKFVNLMSKKQSSNTVIRLFDEEIKELSQSYLDFEDIYDEETGQITITPKTFGDVNFDYEIVTGSTYSQDEKLQQDNLLQLLEILTKNPNIIQIIEQKEGKKISISEIITRLMVNGGIKDWDKIIEDPNNTGGDVDKIRQGAEEQLKQLINGTMGVGEVPPQPQVQPNQQPNVQF